MQVLPDSLGDALSKASAATYKAITKGSVTRCLVRTFVFFAVSKAATIAICEG